MIKISWGTKIALLYLSFVTLIVTMVFMCLHQSIDLVSDDYYEKELVFQNRIDGLNNANALDEKVSHFLTQNELIIQFPTSFKGKEMKGEILFFRPSDASKDYKTDLHLSSKTTQSIALDLLNKGMYKMQVSWEAEGKKYYTEEVIVIP